MLGILIFNVKLYYVAFSYLTSILPFVTQPVFPILFTGLKAVLSDTACTYTLILKCRFSVSFLSIAYFYLFIWECMRHVQIAVILVLAPLDVARMFKLYISNVQRLTPTPLKTNCPFQIKFSKLNYDSVQIYNIKIQ